MWKFYRSELLRAQKVNFLHPRNNQYDNYVPQSWVELDNGLSWLFTNRLSATRLMKVKRMGITEILRRIWLFSANKIKSSESFKPTQLIIELNSPLWHITVTQMVKFKWAKVRLRIFKWSQLKAFNEPYLFQLSVPNGHKISKS